MALNLSQTSVLKLYNTVIEDVIAGVRDSFIDEGIDEQVLQELKQLWENKLMSSKAVEVNPEPPEPQVPQLTTHKNTGVGKVNIANHYVTPQQQQTSAIVNPTIQSQQTQQQQQIASQSQQQQISHRPQVQANANQQPQQQQQVQQVVTVAPTPVLDRQVPVQITLPAQPGVPDATPRILTIHVPASAIQGNQLHTILTGPVISAAMGLPTNLASTVLQQHVNSTLQGQATLAPIQVNQPLQVVTQSTNSVITQRPVQGQTNNIAQLDGELGDTSDEDEDEEEDENDDEDEDFDEKEEEENEEAAAREEEPLNSEDDVTDDDPTDLFDTDNVVVCQYDKITRSRNKWKFYLKDGIMNLTGKDYVFQRANGDAEW